MKKFVTAILCMLALVVICAVFTSCQDASKNTQPVGKLDYDMTGVSFVDRTFSYDGTEHTLEISGTLPDGVKVNYAPPPPTMTEPGQLTVVATFIGDNNHNEIAPMTATLTVVKDGKYHDVVFVFEDGQTSSFVVKHGESISAPDIPPKFGFVGAWDADLENIVADTVVRLVYTELTNEQYFSDENFTPVLRFSVASDVHIGDKTTIRDTRLTTLFEISRSHAENSTTYSGLDLFLFVGDLGDTGKVNQWQAFKRIVDENVGKNSTYIVSMGNHDFRGDKSNPALCIENWKQVFGENSLDTHTVIGGFHFISLSPDLNAGENFSEAKLVWLDKQLQNAVADTPDLPVFVMQHEAPTDTVYGSHDWGSPELNAIFDKYPQVVDFSGHSHFPLADPRSIWQGNYTALGTSTLYYYEMGLNGVQPSYIFPSDKNGGYKNSYNSAALAAEFQVVEVDAFGAIKIVCYNVDSGKVIATRYIRKPVAQTKTEFDHVLLATQSAAPVFVSDAKLTVSVNNSKCTVTIPQAQCETDPVESYRVELYQGNELVETCYRLSDFFFIPMPEKINATFSNLTSSTEYTIKVYAINAWNKQCETPLELTFSTSKF